VLLNEDLADWSAAYLAMWKALESFDPKADRWSEPAEFGTREERIQAAHEAIAGAEQRHKVNDEKRRDVVAFQEIIRKLTAGAPFAAAETEFALRLRDLGSSLADQSVTAANVAEH
jgi:hypothetical protein